MAAHLRFNSKTGLVDPKTKDGQYTEELLQLNDEATVKYRLGALKTVQLYDAEIQAHERDLKMLARLLREGKIAQQQFDHEAPLIEQALKDMQHTLQSYTGELPLPPLPRQRLGVPLFSP